MKAGDIYRESEQILRPFTNSREVSSIEAYCLVSHVLNREKSYLLTHPEEEIPEDQVTRIREMTQKRLTGVPIAYIVGWKEFWSLKLKVTPATLIPRPDTETVVDQALIKASQLKAKNPRRTLRILDMGTGSGAIALALKKELPDAEIDAIDYSDEALRVAQENSDTLGLPVHFWNSDWFKNIKAGHQYDIIVSNPPYIARGDAHLAEGDLRYEPRTALVAPMEGLIDILNIVHQAANYMRPDSWIIIEHGFQQGPDVRHMFHDACFSCVDTIRDLGNNERVTVGALIREEQEQKPQKEENDQ